MRSFRLIMGVAFTVGVLALAPAAAVAKAKDSVPGAGKGNSGNGNGNGNGGSGSGGVVVITPPAACALSDISVGASACGGFFAGNLLSNSPADVAAQSDALAALGLTAWDVSLVEPQLDLATSTVNFATALYGLTYVGIHFGAGATGPSPHTPGGVTGFYRFDAGSNLDTFGLAFGAASGARLYLTQSAPPPAPVTPPGPVTPSVLEPLLPPSSGPSGPLETIVTAVPEPTTWTLMILGFGGIGAILRRRRQAAA